MKHALGYITERFLSTSSKVDAGNFRVGEKPSAVVGSNQYSNIQCSLIHASKHS